MIAGTIVALALILGYSVAVGCMMAAAFGLGSASPEFVVTDHRVTSGYKRLQALIWLACVVAGAFVTCAVAQGTYPWLTPAMLAAALIAILWTNSWEARQRGMAHQILMTVVTIAGVAAGYGLAERLLRI